MSERVIYVAALDHDDGYSLPALAFADRWDAHRWAAEQTDPYVVKAVPIYPAPPANGWDYLASETVTPLCEHRQGRACAPPHCSFCPHPRRRECRAPSPNTDESSTLSPPDVPDPRRTG